MVRAPDKVIKTKKLLLRLNNKQKKLFVDQANECRKYYNDLITLFKEYKWRSETCQIAMGAGASLWEYQNHILEEVSPVLPVPREVLDKISFTNYQSLTYLNKYSRRRIHTYTRNAVCEQIAKTIDSFFKELKKGIYPKIKWRGQDKNTYLGIRGKIKKGKKSGKYEFVLSSRNKIYLRFKNTNNYFVDGSDIKTASIVKTGDQYFLNLTIKEDRSRLEVNDKEVGVDWGVKSLATVSDGKSYGAIDVNELENKVKILQKKLATQKKFGNNWRKTVKKIGGIKRKISNIRNTRIEQVTNDLSKNKLVVIEDLKIKNMTKSAKGDTENPGKMVKQKSGLNRVILNHSPYRFRLRLEQKSKERGGVVKVVNPKNTSRECSKCGHTEKDNRTTQENFKCKKCGHSENADVNAAKNILGRSKK